MWRLGTVPYLNARPLVSGLQDADGIELVQAVPTHLAPELRAGNLDLALVSAVELFRLPALGWIRGPAITSEGPVRSILLYLRSPVEAVRSLALDTSSLSAATLAQVCLKSFHGLDRLELIPAPPEAGIGSLDADAVLRIGDPALSSDPEGRRVLDLGQVWTDQTGLPFVYALWLTRPGLDVTTLVPRLEAARRQGLSRRHQLADEFARRRPLEQSACREYLESCIGYSLGDREQRGLALFGRLAHELGLVDVPELPPPSA
jgi:chorismate dehydratase